MQHKVKDFILELIDEPLQRHCVGYESAAVSMKNDEAKPKLMTLLSQLHSIRVTETNANALIALFNIISDTVNAVIEILERGEAMTVSADYGIVVKAAWKTGWITKLSMTEAENVIRSAEDIDNMPPWLVKWIARHVTALYEEVNTVPPN
jgi:hypothetical protein